MITKGEIKNALKNTIDCGNNDYFRYVSPEVINYKLLCEIYDITFSKLTELLHPYFLKNIREFIFNNAKGINIDVPLFILKDDVYSQVYHSDYTSSQWIVIKEIVIKGRSFSNKSTREILNPIFNNLLIETLVHLDKERVVRRLEGK